MDILRFAVLGTVFLLPFGCGSSEEKPEPEKPNENADVKKDESKPTDSPSTKSPKAESTGTPFAWVPEGTTVFASLRPAPAIESDMMQIFPEGDGLREEMQRMKEDAGFNFLEIDRITVALWPGDGHVVPTIPKMIMEEEARARRRFDDVKKPAAEFEDFPEKDGFEDFPDPGEEKIEDQPEEESVDEFESCQVEGLEEFEDGEPGGEEPALDPMQSMVLNLLPRFDGAVMIHFTEPKSLDDLATSVRPLRRAQNVEIEGKPCRLLAEIPLAGGIAFYQPDPSTLMVTLKDDLAEVLKNEGQSPLVGKAIAQGSELEAALALDFEPFRGLLTMAGGMLGAQVPELNSLFPKLQGTSVFVDLHTGANVDLFVETADADAAQILKTQFDQGYALLGQQKEQFLETVPSFLSEKNQSDIKTLTEDVFQSVKGETNAGQFHVSLAVPDNASTILKEVNEAVAVRSKGMNNMHFITFSLLNYHDVYTLYPFPSGSAEKDSPQYNKLSWRVHVLPYLEQEELYNKFKLDEPWDSEHNKALLEEMPDVFKLSNDAKPGMTQIVAPAGAGFIIDGDKKRRIRDITDGTSNSLVIITVKPEHAVPWTKPGGFKIDPKKAADILGWQGNQFLGGFGDGSARELDVNLEAETIKALLTIGGGEVFDRSVIFGSDFESEFEGEFKEDFEGDPDAQPFESDAESDPLEDAADKAFDSEAEEAPSEEAVE